MIKFTDREIAAVARGAAAAIQQRGHAKGGLVDQTGAVCPEGAIAIALGGRARLHGNGYGHVTGLVHVAAGFRAVQIALAARPGVRRYAGIPDWNDAPERTADEVVAALRGLADALDPPAVTVPDDAAELADVPAPVPA